MIDLFISIGMSAMMQGAVPSRLDVPTRPAAMELVDASSECMVAMSGRLSLELEGFTPIMNTTSERRAPVIVTDVLGKITKSTRVFRRQTKEGAVWQVYRPKGHSCGVVALAGSPSELSSTFTRIMIGDGSSFKLTSGTPGSSAIYEWNIPGSAVGPAVLLRMTANFGHVDRPAVIVFDRAR